MRGGRPPGETDARADKFSILVFTRKSAARRYAGGMINRSCLETRSSRSRNATSPFFARSSSSCNLGTSGRPFSRSSFTPTNRGDVAPHAVGRARRCSILSAGLASMSRKPPTSCALSARTAPFEPSAWTTHSPIPHSRECGEEHRRRNGARSDGALPDVQLGDALPSPGRRTPRSTATSSMHAGQ